MDKDVLQGFDINIGSSFIISEDNEDYFVHLSGYCNIKNAGKKYYDMQS